MDLRIVLHTVSSFPCFYISFVLKSFKTWGTVVSVELSHMTTNMMLHIDQASKVGARYAQYNDNFFGIV